MKLKLPIPFPISAAAAYVFVQDFVRTKTITSILVTLHLVETI